MENEKAKDLTDLPPLLYKRRWTSTDLLNLTPVKTRLRQILNLVFRKQVREFCHFFILKKIS